MSSTFVLEITTPARRVLYREVRGVTLPAYDGEVGILPGHRDFVGLLGTGVLKLVTSQGEEQVMVSSGLWQVKDGALAVLAESAQEGRLINHDEASAELAELIRQPPEANFYQPEYAKYQLALARAQARVETCGKKQKAGR